MGGGSVDELDEERSIAQTMAPAGMAAAALVGFALALSRKRGAAPDAGAGGDGDRGDASPIVQATTGSESAVSGRLQEGESASAAVPLDLASLSPAQATAARAAAAAVALAEQATGAEGMSGGHPRGSDRGGDTGASHSSRDTGREDLEPAGDRWNRAGSGAGGHGGSTPVASALGAGAMVVEGVKGAGGQIRGVAAEAAERVKRVIEDTTGMEGTADGLGGRAQTTVGGAGEATLQTGKRAASPFAWLVAAVTVLVFVLLKPERRDGLTRFADEAAIQAQELLRDLRGYDDEF